MSVLPGQLIPCMIRTSGSFGRRFVGLSLVKKVDWKSMDHSQSQYSDEQLIEAIRGGDAKSLAIYLQRCRIPLLSFIVKNMSDALRIKIEAEDIFQEVSAYAVQNVAEIDFEDHDPFGWFCEIARRRIVDAQRKFAAQKRAAHREVGIFGRGSGNDQTGLVNLLVASITSPSAAFSRQQKEFRLLQALEKLSAEQQDVLKLRYGQGLPSKEIASQIGKSDGATRVLITRSLKKLEGILEQQESTAD